MSMLTVKGLSKKYENTEKCTLNDINISFPKTGLYFILGKSGSGKTTLLNLLSGIDTATTGEIVLDNVDLCKLCETEMDIIRNEKISIIFQDFNLFPNLTVYENVKLSVDIQEWDEKNDNDVDKLIHEALIFVGLQDLKERKINKLSGGEIQRVAVARAVVRKPKVIYADEPTGNLDYKNSEKIFELLREISQTCLVIVITHDRDAVHKYGDGYYEIKDGEIAELIKCNPIEQYCFSMSVTEQGKQVLCKNEIELDELRNNLGDLIKESKADENEYVIKISRVKKVLDSTKSVLTDIHRNHVKKRSLPIKSLFRFAMSVIKASRNRMLITTIMLSLTVVLLMLSAFMTQYDIYKVINGYWNDYSVSEVYPMKEVLYEDSFGDTYSKTVSSGKAFLNVFKNEFQSYTWVKEDIIASYESNDIFNYGEVSIRFVEELEKSDEVVITDCVAEELGIDAEPIGKRIKVNGIYVTVVGVIKTDYRENEVLSNLKYGYSMDAYAQYDLTHKYGVVYASEGFVSILKENKSDISISCSDILTPVADNYITNDYEYSISTDANLNAQSLLAGRLPQKDNEVVISYSYAQEKGYSEKYEDLLSGRPIKLFNLREEHCKEFCMDVLNLYDYFPNGLVVVGIYDDTYSENQEASILFRETVFEKIRDDYYNYYFYDAICIHLEKSRYDEFIELSKQENILYNNPSVYKIREFDSMIGYFGKALLFASCVLSLIVVLMIYNYVENSIHTSKKEIGILRAIGLSKKDTVKIYAVESLMIYLTSIIAATFLSVGLVFFINYQYKKGLTVELFRICYFDIQISMLIILICFVVFVISVAHPIKKFLDKKPIQVIKG